MNGDKDKYESLKKKIYGNVILGNSAPTKVMGKGRIKLEKHAKVVDALLVQGIKQSIIIVG